MKTHKNQIFSFFSGSGLLDLAFENSNFEVVFVNEYFKPFMDAYKFSRQKLDINPPIFGHDETPIEEYLKEKKKYFLTLVNKVRKTDATIGFIGGPPCPDFSVGGKNKGKEGENGKLSQTYADLICLGKPDWFLFENVKGLWRTKKHREFYESLKNQLSKNYCLYERLTNSIEAGAPQDRDRILLFGTKKSVFKKSNLNWEKELQFPNPSAFEHDWIKTSAYKENSKTPAPNNVPLELTVQHWFDTNDVNNHPNQSDIFTPRAGLKKFKVIDEGDVSRKSYKRLHRWRFSPTAAYGNNEVHLHPFESRRISVAEALAIQSMPKEFILPPDMTLSNKFKTIGNGVPYLLGQSVAKLIEGFLSENRIKK